MSEKINENNININFTSLIDYIKDKDIEIEHWRFKHLQEFKNRKKIVEKIDKTIEFLEKYNDDEETNIYSLIDKVIEILRGE